jgi:predicted exporter
MIALVIAVVMVIITGVLLGVTVWQVFGEHGQWVAVGIFLAFVLDLCSSYWKGVADGVLHRERSGR